MDKKESPKARRPLPEPKPPVQRPNTPVIPGTLNRPVSPDRFYAPSSHPKRSSTMGSGHTTYIPPEEPPSYGPATPSYREPELVVDDQSELTTDWGKQLESSWGSADWGGYNKHVANPSLWGVTGTAGNANGYTSMDFWNAPKSLVDIDGRDDIEERHWWDPDVAAKNERPGPGMLPTVLAEELHDPDHSLFSVSVRPPDIPSHTLQMSTSMASINSSTEIAPGSSPAARNAWAAPTPVQSAALPPTPQTASHAQSHYVQPTDDDVRTAVPHPNAYYCPKENGWVILSWKSSSAPLPLAASFANSGRGFPLPAQARRRVTTTCLNKEAPNKTHHFHKYTNAVDAHKLTPPFRLEEWEAAESVKQKRREATVLMDLDIREMSAQDIEMMGQEEEKKTIEGGEAEEEGKLLDLYVCCQCSFYCVASGVLPGVISRKIFEEFVRDKRDHPTPGKTGEQALVLALETLMIVIENTLWKGENRSLRVGRPSFQNKVGWNANTKKIFDILGFVEAQVDEEPALQAPSIDVSTAEGRLVKRKLLRAWVEFGAWVTDFRRVHVVHFRDSPRSHRLWVQMVSAREDYQTAIGAHPDQIPRGELPDNVRQDMQFKLSDWKGLGLTITSYSPELLGFSYYAQCRCHPRASHHYFQYLTNITSTLENSNFGSSPALLQEIVVTERSKDRFTTDEVERAAAILGFGINGPLRVEYDESDVEEGFIENAWRECVKRSWKDSEHGSETLREANEALRILAEARGSDALRKVWEGGREKVMNPEKAYDVLEVPKDVDEMMLITVFNMRMEESPAQGEKMREALHVIAEVRDSERLRRFLELGRDPGDLVAPIRPDLPRGLNQLGNTCYLNSLLQYFYTIKDLREAVLPMSKLDLKSSEHEKLSDDDLKRHRVGGRLVTRREIARSRKFINQLAELFFSLEYCETAAVTPTIELAKLALVTSRDEEEDEADSRGTDSSNDTDATLVDDAPSRPIVAEPTTMEVPQSPVRSPNSVLGKRSREVEKQPSAMDLDVPTPRSPNPDHTTGSPMRQGSDSPPALVSPGSPYATPPEASGSGSSYFKTDNDVEMRAVTPAPSKQPPPLPPRKADTTSDSVMMFGKQHDVAECMDNCMFQIETALLKFDGLNEGQGESSDKTSVVKRLFYGKLRQRLTGDQPSRSSVHEKEDLFSHLPVNVMNDGDIYDGLSHYFDDIVDFDGEKRRMEVSLVDLPPVLQIQLQRVQFNRETLQPYKSQAYVKFWETIYMDRFMDNSDPEKRHKSKAIQSELNSCRDRLRLLLEGKDSSYLASIENARGFLSKLDAPQLAALDDEMIMQLDTEQQLLKAEIDELHVRIDRLKDELEAVWRDSTEMAYELTSVFIHRGSSPSWGHYFFYSRHLPDNPDSWFKYNDSDVTVVSKDEVLADTTGSTANPYLLVFARKGSEVVDTVKRFDTSQLE